MRWLDWQRGRSWAEEDRVLAVKGEQVVRVEVSGGERYDYVARLILERVYLLGDSGTRDGCKAAGICSPVEWDYVNGVFVTLGIKEGYSFRPMTLLDAVVKWRTVGVEKAGYLGADDPGGLRVNGSRWGAVEDKVKQKNRRKK